MMSRLMLNLHRTAAIGTQELMGPDPVVSANTGMVFEARACPSDSELRTGFDIDNDEILQQRTPSCLPVTERSDHEAI